MSDLGVEYVRLAETLSSEKVDQGQDDASRSDKLTISKLDNIKLKEITGITRSNLNSRNHT